MTISNITEIKNPNNKKVQPIKEKQDIFIPNIVDKNIPNRNGFIWLLCGSGGSGKSSMMLSMFKSKNYYRSIFDNIYYFCPESSFSSVQNHPFKKHDKIYHELNVDVLQQVYAELNSKKSDATKEKEKKVQVYEDEVLEESDDEKEIEYSCIIIDDYADVLKDIDIQKQLSKMMIKSRHICCAFIITVQSYLYYPKILRKQLTNISIFKPKNVEEFVSISKELLNMNKDDALTLFNYCFDVNYNHLDINTVDNSYYKNWNKLQILFEKKHAKN